MDLKSNLLICALTFSLCLFLCNYSTLTLAQISKNLIIPICTPNQPHCNPLPNQGGNTTNNGNTTIGNQSLRSIILQQQKEMQNMLQQQKEMQNNMLQQQKQLNQIQQQLG
jgi:hypothetical protein